MEFKEIFDRAVEVRVKYRELEIKKYGRQWTSTQIMEGFVGDVGDLMKLVMAKDGIREKENVDEKIKHELSDCLWSVLVLANEYGIDIEAEFNKTMNELEKRINITKV